MMTGLINILSKINNTGLNWFILIADGTVKGTVILAIIILLVKLRKRLRPQTSHLIIFLMILSLLVIPLLTQGIAVISDSHPVVNGGISLSRISNQPLNQKLEPVIRINPQISSGTSLVYQLPHWSVWLFLIWSIGVMIMLGKLLMETIRTYRLCRNSDRIVNNE